MTTDPHYALTVQELHRLIVQRAAPNGHAPAEFGAWAELVSDLHQTYTTTADANDMLRAGGRADKVEDPADAVRKYWDLLCRQPEYQAFAVALQEAQASTADATTSLDWLTDQLQLIPVGLDNAELRRVLDPVLTRIIDLPDETLVIACLEELRRFFQWKRDTFQAYRTTVVNARRRAERERRSETADAPADAEELGESQPPPLFLSPALAMHEGIVYVSQMMAFRATQRSKRGAITAEVWRPVIISSDRRRIVPLVPPDGAPDGAITWLDPVRRLALEGGMIDAPTGRWSYDSMVAFLHGATTAPTAHVVYDTLMASLRRYVYHPDHTSYVVDVLWAMGTYFYRMWNAYPYLALHGEKGAGKSTLLTWLSAICFNAEFVVNTSEASLYRSIQAKAPTLLIDEQEGLNSSKAAKETKADLMGILKSGYKAGARVARQDMDQKERTRYFDVYSPKALAAIELFEDVLENRAILTFMNRKPAAIQLDDDGAIITRDRSEFGPLRDMLYLLLMERAHDIPKITARVQMDYANRMRELLRPLYAMAALVDLSRGTGRATLDALDVAAKQKSDLRDERDRLSPESTLKEALAILASEADDDAYDYTHATITSEGVLFDTLQAKAIFESLFSSSNQSYYNDHWLGKQVTKLAGVRPATPERRRRTLRVWSDDTSEWQDKTIRVSCYLIDPSAL